MQTRSSPQPVWFPQTKKNADATVAQLTVAVLLEENLMKKKDYPPYDNYAQEFQDKVIESRIKADITPNHKTPKHQWRQHTERLIHALFLILGLITVGCVLLITIYLVISGIPAIREIGLIDFLFGKEWASTASEPKYGILPFILTSVYGTTGAILLGVPIGFMTAVYLSKLASPKVKSVMQSAVSLLAGIPSVVYGLVGMLVLVPAIRMGFNVPDGASLLAAIIVLAIMILPSIIKMSITALDAVPKEYEDASLALGATPIETYFKVSVPAAKSGIAAAVVLGVGRAIGEAMAVMMVAGNVPNMPDSLFQSVRFLTTAVAAEMAYSSGLQRQALFNTIEVQSM